MNLIKVFEIDNNSRKEQYFHIYENDVHVGNCGLRYTLDDECLGNIEYEIFEEYRGHNYSQEACMLLGSIAYDNGFTKLMITANVNNLALIKIIENLNAKFVKVMKVPKKSRLYKQGDRDLNVYEWNLERKIK